MMNFLKRPMLGVRLLAVLVLVLANSCRESTPPPIENCLGDGTGGARCSEPNSTNLYRLPSELKGYWMTNESDMVRFSSWCYDTSESNVIQIMNVIKSQALDEPHP